MSYSASPSRPYLKLDETTEPLQPRLRRIVVEFIDKYGLIDDGDKIMGCLWAEDSYALLDVLFALQRRAPIHFDLVTVNLDQNSRVSCPYNFPTISRRSDWTRNRKLQLQGSIQLALEVLSQSADL